MCSWPDSKERPRSGEASQGGRDLEDTEDDYFEA